MLQLIGIVVGSGSLAVVSPGFYVGGDSIGADSSTTDNTGGFTAVRQNGVNLGQPAILVSLTGQELLTELRVIAFGVAATNGNLFFDDFNYRLELWRSDDYFALREAEFSLALGGPVGIRLVPDGPTSVVPDTPFGTAGVGGDDATTYDFRFDLTPLPLLDSPLAAGDWVLGFQSWHDTASSGSLRVTGSGAEQGPLPLFSRDDLIPRGILGGQDPNDVTLFWGMSLAAVPEVTPCNLAGDFNADSIVDAADYTLWRDGLGADHSESEYELWKSAFGMTLPDPVPGDFNGDGAVNAADYTVWRDNLGAADESLLCHAGDGLQGVDAGDYALWRQNFGAGNATLQSLSASVAEPASLLLIAGGGLVFNRQRPRPKSSWSRVSAKPVDYYRQV